MAGFMNTAYLDMSMLLVDSEQMLGTHEHIHGR